MMKSRSDFSPAFKIEKQLDAPFLNWLRTLPCVVKRRRETVIHTHHLLRNVPHRGTASKTGDNYALPLDPAVHSQLHFNGNEEEFLKSRGINNPVSLAERLYAIFNAGQSEFEACLAIVRAYHA